MKPRHILEYLGLRLGLALVDRVPPSICDRLTRFVADLTFLAAVRRRRTACDNIRQCGIASSNAEIRRIARNSFRHFAILAVESLRYDRVGHQPDIRAKMRLEIPPETRTLLESPQRGLMVVSGHIGNWEIAARLLSEFKPVTGITRPLKNVLSEKLIRERKGTDRVHLTPKHDADSLRLLKVLRRGEILALLVDQHAWDRPMIVDFFGRPAATHASVALMHLVTRAPLCFGYCLRTGPMAYTLTVLPPFSYSPTGDRDGDIRAVLTWLNGQLEEVVRAHPEQYLWAHRRWRTPSVLRIPSPGHGGRQANSEAGQAVERVNSQTTVES